jgi:hypothetical protein
MFSLMCETQKTHCKQRLYGLQKKKSFHFPRDAIGQNMAIVITEDGKKEFFMCSQREADNLADIYFQIQKNEKNVQ